MEMQLDLPTLRLVLSRRDGDKCHGGDSRQIDLLQRDRCAGPIHYSDLDRHLRDALLRNAVGQLPACNDYCRRTEDDRLLLRDRWHSIRAAIRVRCTKLHYSLRRIT